MVFCKRLPDYRIDYLLNYFSRKLNKAQSKSKRMLNIINDAINSNKLKFPKLFPLYDILFDN